MNRCPHPRGLSAGKRGRFTVTLTRSHQAASQTEAHKAAPIRANDAARSSLESTSGVDRVELDTSLAVDGHSMSKTDVLKVSDFMTSPAISLSPDMSVFDAMVLMVDKGVSGMPVTNDKNQVIGVCSGYDLLALDSTPGKLDKSFFPPIDKCIKEFGGDRALMWSNFKDLRRKITAVNCDTVGQVMHNAFIMDADAELEDAANMVVQKRAHRICVVNKEGELVGIVSRGDLMRTTIAQFRVYMRNADNAEEKKMASEHA